MSTDSKDLRILLVEDDELDIMGIRRALEQLNIPNLLTVSHDGIEALEYLQKTQVEHGLAPHLILLDINMPRMDGMEFLSELREDSELKASKVFILTGSSEDDHIFRAYQQDVAGYIVKSEPLNSLKSALRLLNLDWLDIQE